VTYVIAAPCIDHLDQACVDVCPVDCIASEPGLDRKFYIDPEGCIECGSCESACPNGAISRVDRLPHEWRAFAAIDALWFEDQDAARRMVDTLVREAA